MADRTTIIHPAWLRAMHWTNAAAMTVMVLSGWQIYDASPIFAFRFSHSITSTRFTARCRISRKAADQLLARGEIPFPPRRNDLDVGLERIVTELEAAFAFCARMSGLLPVSNRMRLPPYSMSAENPQSRSRDGRSPKAS